MLRSSLSVESFQPVDSCETNVTSNHNVAPDDCWIGTSAGYSPLSTKWKSVGQLKCGSRVCKRTRDLSNKADAMLRKGVKPTKLYDAIIKGGKTAP